jgi:hypothetical protein
LKPSRFSLLFNSNLPQKNAQFCSQEKLTKLSYRQELERFLSYGKWDLTDDDIERINKDEENRQRVSIFTAQHTTQNT